MRQQTIVIIVGMIISLGFAGEVIFLYFALAETPRLQQGWMWVGLFLTPPLLGTLIYVILQRFRELKEEAKHDLSKY